MTRRRTRAGARARRLAVAGCGLVLATTLLAACGAAEPADTAESAPSDEPAASLTGDMTAQSRPTARADSTEAHPAVARSGARFAHALTERGIPAESLSDGSTLAQVARGLCSRVADGTPEAEIRTQLAPVIDFATSVAPDSMPDDQVARAFVDAARESVC